MRIKNSNVLISGGASGIGLRTANELIKRGAKVSVLDNNKVALKKLKLKGTHINAIVCDLTNTSEVEKCVQKVLNDFGKIDILINNAAIMNSAPLINPFQKKQRCHSIRLWKKTIEINLNSVFYLTRIVANHMAFGRGGGLILNIGSISAQGNAGQSAYSASKAAVEALTKVWAKELGPYRIRCATISPGFIETKGTFAALNKKNLEDWIEKVPLRRFGAVDEMVDGILFAIKNDFFNGRSLQIDGGLII